MAKKKEKYIIWSADHGVWESFQYRSGFFPSHAAAEKRILYELGWHDLRDMHSAAQGIHIYKLPEKHTTVNKTSVEELIRKVEAEVNSALEARQKDSLKRLKTDAIDILTGLPQEVRDEIWQKVNKPKATKKPTKKKAKRK